MSGRRKTKGQKRSQIPSRNCVTDPFPGLPCQIIIAEVFFCPFKLIGHLFQPPRTFKCERRTVIFMVTLSLGISDRDQWPHKFHRLEETAENKLEPFSKDVYVLSLNWPVQQARNSQDILMESDEWPDQGLWMGIVQIQLSSLNVRTLKYSGPFFGWRERNG